MEERLKSARKDIIASHVWRMEIWKGTYCSFAGFSDENKTVLFIFNLFFASYSSSTSGTIMAAHLSQTHNLHLTTATTEKNQRKLTDIFFLGTAKKRKVVNKWDAQHTLNRQFTLWLCCDLLPFATVKKKGFQDFWKETIGNKAELPSTTTVSVGALNDTYICFKNRLIEVLSKASKYGSMTFDFWTDNHKRLSYITYTYHYMDEWTIKTFVLKTAAFGQSTISENVKFDFETTLDEFQLTEKKITIVTDNGGNMIRACRLLNVMRMPCIAHCIHSLIMTYLLKHPLQKDFFEMFLKRLREIHYALVFKYKDLKLYDNEEKQKKNVRSCERGGRYGYGKYFLFLFIWTISYQL